jgi:Tfp pilus assembly protein PilO
VSGSAHGSTLVRRVAGEHRRALVALGVLLVVNIAGYIGIVYPLGQRVANIQQRDQSAEQELAAARADYAQASGTLTGKDRAATELQTFYADVLPTSLTAARASTHLRLPQLAQQSGLRYERSTTKEIDVRDSTLRRLQIEMILSGSYAEMRTFIHQLETSPEFVVIDNVSLGEDDINAGGLVVTLQLSTYYREAER